MIISPGRGHVFVHIPKTGGTALALALEARARADDILIGDTPKARRRRHRLAALTPAGRLWKHSTLADIDGIMPHETLAALFVFTVVRNPWDRMVSYYHWLRAQRFDHPAVRLAQTATFSGFLGDPQTAAALQANPYARYVTDAGGIERCDLWLRHESLADDTAILAGRLGLRLDLPAGVNASDRARDWRGYYNDADAARLAEICARDIDRFGYRFDPPA